MQTYIKRNNDHTQIMRETQFRSSFKLASRRSSKKVEILQVVLVLPVAS